MRSRLALMWSRPNVRAGEVVALYALRTIHPRETHIYRRYRTHTMLPEARAIDNLAVVRKHVHVSGDIVECGTWKGGMSAAMADVMPGRRSVLFDSFEGLPEPTDQDSERAQTLYNDSPLVASETEAELVMQRSRSRAYEIRKGWFETTVPAFAAEQPRIAVLRLDGDWYESTMTCLTHLFPLVERGGVVIIDDYYDWPGCTRAVHHYLSQEDRPEPIVSTRLGRTVWLQKYTNG